MNKELGFWNYLKTNRTTQYIMLFVVVCSIIFTWFTFSVSDRPLLVDINGLVTEHSDKEMVEILTEGARIRGQLDSYQYNVSLHLALALDFLGDDQFEYFRMEINYTMENLSDFDIYNNRYACWLTDNIDFFDAGQKSSIANRIWSNDDFVRRTGDDIDFKIDFYEGLMEYYGGE